jgi:cytochrome c-type biogenesis protein CcmH
MLADEIAAVRTSGKLPSGAEPTAARPADLSAAIAGMVDGLAARLQARPDDPAGWVRLVRAYAVLGEIDKRERALGQARTRFAGRPEVLAALAEAGHTPPMSRTVR